MKKKKIWKVKTRFQEQFFSDKTSALYCSPSFENWEEIELNTDTFCDILNSLEEKIRVLENRVLILENKELKK